MSSRNMIEEGKPDVILEQKAKPSKPNTSLRLLKQHMLITNLQEELKTLKLEKKELVYLLQINHLTLNTQIDLYFILNEP